MRPDFGLRCRTLLLTGIEEDFAGYRFRLAERFQEQINDFACRRHIDGQAAEWQVKVGHPLVDGYWLNTDTKTRYPIVSYTKGGYTTPCDPSVGPPEKPYTATVGGPYIVFGPFTLTPPDADGGYWEGMWKTQYDKDFNRVLTAEAKGHGGLLEGKSLHISAEIRLRLRKRGAPASAAQQLRFPTRLIRPKKSRATCASMAGS